MKVRLPIIALLLALSLAGRNGTEAQSTKIPVSHPIHGRLVFQGNLPQDPVGLEKLFLADGFTGEWQVLAQNERGIASPVWNNDGTLVAYHSGGSDSNIVNINTGATQTIQSFPGHNGIFFPQSWSVDGQKILYIYYYGLNEPQKTNSLDLFDTSTQALISLLSYQEGQSMNDLVPWPGGATAVKFNTIRQATWNPVYDQWIVVQLDGLITNNDETVESNSTLLFNRNTRVVTSLDKALSDEVDTLPISWSRDGKALILETKNAGNEILQFNDLNTSSSFAVIAKAQSFPQAIFKWFGVGDLFLVQGYDTKTNDLILSIGEIVHNQWHSTEFLRLLDTTFYSVQDLDWFVTASDEEKQALTCLFDQAQPARVGIGTRARVSAANGLPLRSQPTFDSDVLQQMPEGTTFEVMGGSACANGEVYDRFWQLKLDDGTVGWAVEADQQGYFIEPAQAVSPAATSAK